MPKSTTRRQAKKGRSSLSTYPAWRSSRCASRSTTYRRLPNCRRRSSTRSSTWTTSSWATW
eukprot:4630113-Pleurochrysis_carterae.AAC.1